MTKNITQSHFQCALGLSHSTVRHRLQGRLGWGLGFIKLWGGREQRARSQRPPWHRRRPDVAGLWRHEPGNRPCLRQAGRRLGFMIPSHSAPKLLRAYTLLLQNSGKNRYLPTVFSSPGGLCVLCLHKYTYDSFPSIPPFGFLESHGDFVCTVAPRYWSSLAVFTLIKERVHLLWLTQNVALQLIARLDSISSLVVFNLISLV